MLYIRFPLSLRNVEDLLYERSIEISHETVGYWWNRFGPMFAVNIQKGLFGFVRILARNYQRPRVYSERWGGCRSPKTASQCAKLGMFYTQATGEGIRGTGYNHRR